MDKRIELENIILTPGMHKYIHVVDEDGDSHIYNLNLGYHSQILEEIKERVGDYRNIEGGFIRFDPEKRIVEIEGKSQDFGKADHGHVKAVLQKGLGDEYQVSIDTGFLAEESRRQAEIIRKEIEKKNKEEKAEFDEKKRHLLRGYTTEHQEIIDQLPVEKRFAFYENMDMVDKMPECDRKDYVRKTLDSRLEDSKVSVDDIVDLLDKAGLRGPFINEVISDASMREDNLDEIFDMLEDEKVNKDNYHILLSKAICNNSTDSDFSDPRGIGSRIRSYENLKSCYRRMKKICFNKINQQFIDTLMKNGIALYFNYADADIKKATLDFMRQVSQDNEVDIELYDSLIKKAIFRNAFSREAEEFVEAFGIDKALLDEERYEKLAETTDFKGAARLACDYNIPVKGKLKRKLEAYIEDKISSGRFGEVQETARSFVYDESSIVRAALNKKIETSDNMFRLYEFLGEALESVYSVIAKDVIDEFHRNITMEDKWYWESISVFKAALDKTGKDIHRPEDDLTADEKKNLTEHYKQMGDELMRSGERGALHYYYDAKRLARVFGLEDIQKHCISGIALDNYTSLDTLVEHVDDAGFDMKEFKGTAETIYQKNFRILETPQYGRCPYNRDQLLRVDPGAYLQLARFARDTGLDQGYVDKALERCIDRYIAEGKIRQAYNAGKEFGRPSGVLMELMPFI